ncbi:MAG: VWA domain-containing protein [Bacteroidetes bacterium]|nr:VWA domain-containing protein [Bacteroidota bacterium]
MKMYILPILMLIQSLSISAQTKKEFDLNAPEPGKTLFKGQLSQLAGRIKNQQLDLTLQPTGFFTLGTSLGASSSILDDDCQITYGHPWAKTSFPGFELDGDQFTLDKLSKLVSPQVTFAEDSVSVSYQIEGKFNVTFTLKLSGNIVQSKSSITNLSTAAQTLAPFLVLDPALGKWGDGSILADQFWLGTETVIGPDLPESFKLWERNNAPKGVSLGISFPAEKPVEIVAQNWRNLYENKGLNTNLALYDLCLKFNWGLSLLNPAETRTASVYFEISTPEWGNSTFTRWDLEPFASIQGGLLFPSSVKTTVEISNAGSSPLSQISLGLNGNNLFNSDTVSTQFNIATGARVYKNVTLTIPELFESVVGTPVLSIYQTGILKEQIQRNYFIPGIPVSESGLTVTIDTVTHPSGNLLNIYFRTEITETGQVLNSLKPKNIQVFGGQDRISTFSLATDTSNGANQLDLVFVLDVTGSMTDEIASVRNNIIEFTDSLKAKNSDFRLGMVTFGDEIRGVYPFTRDVEAFKTLVGNQTATGGNDIPENSLGALGRASEFPFRPTAKRMFIWITDANYHSNNSVTSLTIQQVVNQLTAQTILVNCIGSTGYQTNYYDPITLPTGGSFYDINGKFRDILLDIARLTTSSRMVISFKSPTPVSTGYTGEIKVYYGGLGGKATYSLEGSQSLATRSKISLYPNPFNPTTTIRVLNQNSFGGRLKIFNILGQQVRLFNFDPGQTGVNIQWNGSGENGDILASGIYFIRAEFLNARNQVADIQTVKVYFLK